MITSQEEEEGYRTSGPMETVIISVLEPAACAGVKTLALLYTTQRRVKDRFQFVITAALTYGALWVEQIRKTI